MYLPCICFSWQKLLALIDWSLYNCYCNIGPLLSLLSWEMVTLLTLSLKVSKKLKLEILLGNDIYYICPLRLQPKGRENENDFSEIGKTFGQATNLRLSGHHCVRARASAAEDVPQRRQEDDEKRKGRQTLAGRYGQGSLFG